MIDFLFFLHSLENLVLHLINNLLKKLRKEKKIQILTLKIYLD